MNDKLNRAIEALRDLENTNELRLLTQHMIKLSGRRPQLSGKRDGYANYSRHVELDIVRQMAEQLTADERQTFSIVVEMLYDLLCPKVEHAQSGYIQLKTMMKSSRQIDVKTGRPKLDDDGVPIILEFEYTYCYIRQFATNGNEERGSEQLLSIYADRGMGKGGNGGYVAYALAEKLVTEDDILSAWYAGEQAYNTFIDECEAWTKASDTQSNPNSIQR